MDKKTLLAEATRKLERQTTPTAPSDDAPAGGAQPAEPSAKGSPAPKPGVSPKKVQPVVSKGITLRPANVEKLDRLELSLRKQGIKAGHSGLIQIAIDLLEDNAQLATAYRELLKLDLRLK